LHSTDTSVNFEPQGAYVSDMNNYVLLARFLNITQSVRYNLY